MTAPASDFEDVLEDDGWAESLQERLGARLLSELPTDPPPPLLVERLDPLGHTILYGTGGVGKGTVATAWSAGLVTAGHRVLILDYENHPEEWARRYRGIAGVDGADSILWVAPLTADWHGERGSLWRQAEDIRALATSWGAT